MIIHSNSPRASRNNRLLFASYHNYLDPSNGASIQLGYNPVDNGGGLRCFPEQSEPGGDVHNEILAVVTLAAPIPSGMTGTVFVDWFDPDNPRGSTKSPTQNGPDVRDNHGVLYFWDDAPENSEDMTFGRLIFAGGTQQQWKSCELTSDHAPEKPNQIVVQAAHAGDNYIIAAHPNKYVVQDYLLKSDGKTLSYPNASGGMTTLPTNLRSDMLTVWRTLNVELDVCYWPYYPPGDLTAPLDGLVATQLARACVVTKEFSPNLNGGPNIDNPMSYWDAQDAVEDGRDIYGNSRAFWTVRIVTMSRLILNDPQANPSGDTQGHFWPAANGISIYLQRWLDYQVEWNMTDAQTKDRVRQTVLHELAHLLIDGDEGRVVDDPFFDIEDIQLIQKHSRAIELEKPFP